MPIDQTMTLDELEALDDVALVEAAKVPGVVKRLLDEYAKQAGKTAARIRGVLLLGRLETVKARWGSAVAELKVN
jgi:hypothetical protein